MEVSLLTNLVPSSLLVQATFVPVSYDCSCGQLMKNLSRLENKTKAVILGLNTNCCQVSNRKVSEFLTNISQTRLLSAQHIKFSKYLFYVKYTKYHSLGQKSIRWLTKKKDQGTWILMLQCFLHASKFVSLKQRKPLVLDSIWDRAGQHISCIALRLICWTFKSWQYLFINVYYTGRGIIWWCPSARNCWTALTLPVVIFRSAVDTIVDTVFPLTFAVKVAYKKIQENIKRGYKCGNGANKLMITCVQLSANPYTTCLEPLNKDSSWWGAWTGGLEPESCCCHVTSTEVRPGCSALDNWHFT